ncbi:hypothetical protein [Rhodococcus sp. 14-2470-1a]|uniref:hypothetical protein n=1 Tax=Rhodococcus sp. 14-2470-1a TaxID=2023150 RepID=UPI00211B7176|nr:hypothetical protein [Rhodococcus sp. 14-2470-1a]
MSPTGRSVDEILDAGAVGLLYFERYLPILHRLTADTAWAYPALCARYDQQRGLDLAVLSEDARLLGDGVVSARRELDKQRALLGDLAQAWVGSAAESAVADIASDTTLADQRVLATEQLAQVLGQAAERIRGAVEQKASETARFDPTVASEWGAIDGKMLEIVERIDTVATVDLADPTSLDRAKQAADALVDMLPVFDWPVSNGPLSADSAPRKLMQNARDVCDEWLRTVLVPVVSAACRTFTDICSSIDQAVRDHLTTVALVAEAVRSEPFPSAPQPPWGCDGPNRRADGGGGTQTLPLAQQNPPDPRHDGVVLPARVQEFGPDVVDSQPGSAPITPGNVAVPGDPATSGERRIDPSEIRAGLESLLGEVPSSKDIIAAIERSGAEMVERTEAAIEALLDRLSSPDGVGENLLPPAESNDAPRSPGPSDAGDPADTTERNRPDERPDPSVAQNHPVSPFVPGPPVMPPPVAGGDVERGHVEAAFDGHSARLSLAHNGNVALQLGTPDGESRRFELKPGPFGLPIVECTTNPEPPAPAPGPPALPPEPTALPSESAASGTEQAPAPDLPPAQLPTPEPPTPEPPTPEPPTPEPPTPEPPTPEPPTPEPPVTSEPDMPAPAPAGSGARLTQAGPL